VLIYSLTAVAIFITWWSFYIRRSQGLTHTTVFLTRAYIKATIVYLIASNLVWIAGLIASILSCFVCGADGDLEVGTYNLSFHLNVAADVATLAEVVFCASVGITINIPPHLTRRGVFAFALNNITALFGLASSVCAIVGLATGDPSTQNYGHAAIGFICWGLGSIFREWNTLLRFVRGDCRQRKNRPAAAVAEEIQMD
jgi:hypothetical protein